MRRIRLALMGTAFLGMGSAQAFVSPSANTYHEMSVYGQLPHHALTMRIVNQNLSMTIPPRTPTLMQTAVFTYRRDTATTGYYRMRVEDPGQGVLCEAVNQAQWSGQSLTCIAGTPTGRCNVFANRLGDVCRFSYELRN